MQRCRRGKLSSTVSDSGSLSTTRLNQIQHEVSLRCIRTAFVKTMFYLSPGVNWRFLMVKAGDDDGATYQ